MVGMFRSDASNKDRIHSIIELLKEIDLTVEKAYTKVKDDKKTMTIVLRFNNYNKMRP